MKKPYDTPLYWLVHGIIKVAYNPIFKSIFEGHHFFIHPNLPGTFNIKSSWSWFFKMHKYKYKYKYKYYKNKNTNNNNNKNKKNNKKKNKNNNKKQQNHQQAVCFWYLQQWSYEDKVQTSLKIHWH